jgi:hypothetical protein
LKKAKPFVRQIYIFFQIHKMFANCRFAISEFLALIEGKILLCQGSAQKIEADSRNQLQKKMP